MIPDNVPSSSSVLGAYLFPDDQFISDLSDWELGGIALSDNSMGLMYQAWHCVYENEQFVLTAQDTGTRSVIHTDTGVVQLSFTFDQNMRWQLAYSTDRGQVVHIWYDPTIATYRTTVYNGIITPRLCLDDKRPVLINDSDVIMFYSKDGNICFRAQRERFMIEHVYASGYGAGLKLYNCGMSVHSRVLLTINRETLSDEPFIAGLQELNAQPPIGKLGVQYDYPLGATGGTAPYTWSYRSGVLPPGLAVVGNAVTGVPTVAGTYETLLDVFDSSRQLKQVRLDFVVE